MKIITLSLLLLLTFGAFAQIPDVSIYEDYTNPSAWMWKPTNEFRTGKIENGMYVSKGKRESASLGFPYDLSEKQKQLNEASDMEFEVVKLEGAATSPITITLKVMEFETPYDLKLNFNELGEWSLTGGDNKQLLGSGKTTGKSESNLVKIIHRKNDVKYFLNNEFLFEYKFKYTVEISWWLIYISSADKDVVLGLDKTVFKAYSASTILLEEMALQAEKEKAERNSNFIVKDNFPEGKATYSGTSVRVAFDYNAKWKLEDFENKEFLGPTGVELTVSKSETGGYFLITTDTTSLSYEAYYKKYVDINYFTNGVKIPYNNIIDAEPKINGEKAKMREVIVKDTNINPTGTIELWCLIIKNNRYYMLYSICYPADRASVLSTFNSFKILD